jgi:hypothetical protein
MVEMRDPLFPVVIPAKAGIQGRKIRRLPWIPAFAGMTEERARIPTNGLLP